MWPFLQTKGVPIEEVSDVVRSHWFWRRVAYPGGIVPHKKTVAVGGVPVEVPEGNEYADKV